MRGQFGAEEMQERRNVLYCLNILDKGLCWATALAPSISVTDDDDILGHSTTQSTDEVTSANYVLARARLACIEEQIIAELYSPKTESRTHEQTVWAGIIHLGEKLHAWSLESGICASNEGVKDSSPSLELPANTELAISFYSTRLLLNWPARQDSGANDSLIDDSRACLKLFRRSWTQFGSESGQGVSLAR
jgi:hypothetical protein